MPPSAKHRRANVLIVALIIIAPVMGLGASVHSARAQGDTSPLTEEQRQWLERVQQALFNLDALTNYTAIHSGSAFSELSLKLEGDTLAGSQAQSWQQTHTVFPGDPPNIAATITSTHSTVEFGADAAISFGLVADVRWVDDVLYVNATPLDAGSGVPDVPPGWIIVADPADYDVFTSLHLDNIIDQTSIFDDLDALYGVVEDVTREPVTLDDGAPADQITITYNRDLIFLEAYGLSAANRDYWQRLFDIANHVESTIRATIILDADMLPVAYASELIWQIEGADATVLWPDGVPAGATLDLQAETVQESTIIAVNEARDPATAPDNVAEAAESE